MPYIKNEDRARLVNDPFDVRTSGELNYMVTLLVRNYIVSHGLNYQTCNDIVGALDNAKGEFRRRVQDPYEDEKIKSNGDVY